MLAFVTVGSTCFDGLIQSVFSSSVLSSLSEKGYSNVVVQCGNSEIPYAYSLARGEESFQLEKDGVSIECWKFKPSLQMDYEKADLVISHAGTSLNCAEWLWKIWWKKNYQGSGTILDVLRMDKPLIVVPNPTLLDNHQEELASALEELGHLRSSTTLWVPVSFQFRVAHFSVDGWPELSKILTLHP